MDGNFDQFGGPGLQNGQRRSFDSANTLEAFVQQDIGQQQARSPGYRESFNSRYPSSPTPPTTTHQQTRPQPYAAHPSSAFFQISPINMPQSTGSPVSPHFTLTADPNYAFGLDFGGMSTHDASMGGMRNNSVDITNFSMPNSRPPTSSIDQQTAVRGQRPLPQFPVPQTSASVHTPHISSPVRPPAQPRRRYRGASIRTNHDEEPIGLVLVSKKKFKCAKTDCKELTFGRLADLRRHYDQQHSHGGEVYFCSYSGCQRSHASTGGKGRSFGSRKDKRDEHERNVHAKNSPTSRDYRVNSAESF